ncbi:unnamed protein product, partial [Musa acuminata var. zebrina]
PRPTPIAFPTEYTSSPLAARERAKEKRISASALSVAVGFVFFSLFSFSCLKEKLEGLTC